MREKRYDLVPRSGRRTGADRSSVTPKGRRPHEVQRCSGGLQGLLAPDGGDVQEANPEMVELGRPPGQVHAGERRARLPRPATERLGWRSTASKIGTGPGEPKFDKAAGEVPAVPARPTAGEEHREPAT